jgi:hypothetical protein
MFDEYKFIYAFAVLTAVPTSRYAISEIVTAT